MKLLLISTIFTIFGVTGFFTFAENKPVTTERQDCPGKIICPITGQEICKDQCPLQQENQEMKPQNNQERTDCPGKIICPITGQEICKDQCPLENGKDKGECCK